MRFCAVVVLAFGLAGGSFAAHAAEGCANPEAIGTSRTIEVDSTALPRIGTMQYRRSLPLEDHEVVITFDDGPLPPYTNRVLDALAAECVKVTYFIVGQMARAYPDTVRRLYNSGHTIGTHTNHHPFGMDHMDAAQAAAEIDGGVAAVKAALGDERALAPFFRVPGLARSNQIEALAATRSLSVWSADEVADDWHRITAQQIVDRAIARIEAKNHRGVLLLHDIHGHTATAVPILLRELKAKGYRIVHAVPTGERPASVPERSPDEIAQAQHDARTKGWPRIVRAQKPQPEAEAEAPFMERLLGRKTATQTAAHDDTSSLFNR